MYLVIIKICLSVFCTCCVYQYVEVGMNSITNDKELMQEDKRYGLSDIQRALSRSAEKASPSQVYTQVKRHPILV